MCQFLSALLLLGFATRGSVAAFDTPISLEMLQYKAEIVLDRPDTGHSEEEIFQQMPAGLPGLTLSPSEMSASLGFVQHRAQLHMPKLNFGEGNKACDGIDCEGGGLTARDNKALMEYLRQRAGSNAPSSQAASQQSKSAESAAPSDKLTNQSENTAVAGVSSNQFGGLSKTSSHVEDRGVFAERVSSSNADAEVPKTMDRSDLYRNATDRQDVSGTDSGQAMGDPKHTTWPLPGADLLEEVAEESSADPDALKVEDANNVTDVESGSPSEDADFDEELVRTHNVSHVLSNSTVDIEVGAEEADIDPEMWETENSSDQHTDATAVSSDAEAEETTGEDLAQQLLAAKAEIKKLRQALEDEKSEKKQNQDTGVVGKMSQRGLLGSHNNSMEIQNVTGGHQCAQCNAGCVVEGVCYRSETMVFTVCDSFKKDYQSVYWCPKPSENSTAALNMTPSPNVTTSHMNASMVRPPTPTSEAPDQPDELFSQGVDQALTEFSDDEAVEEPIW